MITSWRIVAAEHADDAFSGEGARLYGGRWTSAGLPVVYTAQSASLAALEMLVHLNRQRRMPDYVLFAATFVDELMEIAPELPKDWRSDPAPPLLQQIGDAWVMSASSAVLRVPSAVVDTEFNYLLNPTHRDFNRIEIGAAQPFSFDLRLLRHQE